MKVQRMVVYVKCFDLTRWLLERSDGFSSAASHQLLRARVQAHAVELLEDISLALQFRVGRLARLEQANALVMRLRIELRLVQAARLLEPRQVRHAMQLLDEVGSLIGGIQRQEARRNTSGALSESIGWPDVPDETA